MRWGVWLVSTVALGPLLLLLAGRVTRARARPAWAAVGLLVGIAATAGATLCAVAVFAWTVPARIRLVGSLGQWTSGNVERATRIPLALGVVATIAGVLIIANLVRVVTAHERLARETKAAVRELSAVDGVVLIDDDLPFAHALSAWRPPTHVILVSTGMQAALAADELAAVLAHERSHVHYRHGWFRQVGLLGTAINPLLQGPDRELGFALERWADEDAAATAGRQVIARALGHAALSRIDMKRAGSRDGSDFGAEGVPDRIAALGRAPARGRWIAFAAYAVVFLFVSGAVVRALERSEDLLEALQNLR